MPKKIIITNVELHEEVDQFLLWQLQGQGQERKINFEKKKKKKKCKSRKGTYIKKNLLCIIVNILKSKGQKKFIILSKILRVYTH